MPARMISQKKAASNKVKVINALANAPTLMGSLLPKIQAPNQGTKKKNQKITSTRGSDRMRFTYAPAKADRGLMGDKRISASAVPSTTPPTMDKAVRVRVKVMPSLNRYCQERAMTSKS